MKSSDDIMIQLVGLRLNIEDIAKAIAHSIYDSSIVFAPSGVRGNALINVQGDHSTAYALYLESIRSKAKKAFSEMPKISKSFNAIYEVFSKDKEALEECNLLPDKKECFKEITKLEKRIFDKIKSSYKSEDSKKEFIVLHKPENKNKLFGFKDYDKRSENRKEMLKKMKRRGIDTSLSRELNDCLRKLELKFETIKHIESWSIEFDQLVENILSLKEKYDRELSEKRDGEKTVSEAIEAIRKTSDKNNVASRLSNLKEVFKKEKKNLRKNYFYNVIREVSEKYLLYQNASLFVTFYKIDEVPAPKNEASKISQALKKLRKTNIMLDDSKNESEEEIDEKEILEKIETLLFFEKIPEKALKKLNSDRKEILNNNRKKVLNFLAIRDNNINVLAYIIARHIKTIFDAFPNFRNDVDLNNYIVKEFPLTVYRKWGLDNFQKKQVDKKVKNLLEIYSCSENNIDASLLHSSDNKSDSSDSEKKKQSKKEDFVSTMTAFEEHKAKQTIRKESDLAKSEEENTEKNKTKDSSKKESNLSSD